MKTLALFLLLTFPALAQDNSPFTLGNPGASDSTLTILEKSTLTVAYSQERNVAAFVGWHLQTSDLGNVPRYVGGFYPDAGLPKDWYKVSPADYTGTGYDRGHLCDSGDRTATPDQQKETFVMSNVIPQAKSLNEHVWEGLEAYCRTQVKLGREAYIFAGGSGSLGTLGKSKINIPAYCWKVILLMPEGDDDLARVCRDDIGIEIICVKMPNTEAVAGKPWQSYEYPLATLELETGYSFFSKVPEYIVESILAKTK